MSKSTEESVGIRREVDSGNSRFEIQNCTNKRRILMRKAVVFLSSPSTRFDIVDTRKFSSPSAFGSLNDISRNS